MRVWITKLALSRGVFEIEADFCPANQTDQIVQTKPYPKHATFYYGKGINWHDTAQGAMVYAVKMQNAEVQKLRDKAVKLQKKVIKFSPLV